MLGCPLRGMVAEFLLQEIWFVFYYVPRQVGLFLMKYLGNVLT